jgi:hypothetical protein
MGQSSNILDPTTFDQSAFRNLQAAIEQTVREMNQGLHRLFESMKQIDWEATTKDIPRLAELGWTVAPWMGLSDVTELAALDSAAVDREFLKLYLEAGGLEQAKRELARGSDMAEWQPLLDQVFRALGRKDHLIAIPALFLMLEGVAAQVADPTNLKIVRSTNVPIILAAVQSDRASTSFSARIWVSTMIFAEQLYKNSPFSDPCPAFINRHWILHGRLKPTQWELVEAIRLLNALVTLHWLLRRTVTSHN